MAPQLYAYSGINLRWAPHVWLRAESSFWPIRGQNVYQAANQKPALWVCWQFSRARPSRQPHHYTPSKVLKLLGRVRRRQLNSVSPQQSSRPRRNRRRGKLFLELNGYGVSIYAWNQFSQLWSSNIIFFVIFCKLKSILHAKYYALTY